MYFYAIGLCVSILRDAWFSLISFVNRFESLKALYEFPIIIIISIRTYTNN